MGPEHVHGEQASEAEPAAAAAAAARPGIGSPSAVLALQRAAGNRATARALARKVEMRDVGKGEFSGFDRLGEIVDRLSALSPTLFYEMDGNKLTYRDSGLDDPSPFDRQMMALIDRDELIPLRLTNRHGLLGNRKQGFHFGVDGDAFFSGYVDVDDLLACDDMGFMLLLVHFMTERAVTKNYARRIGIDDPAKGGFTEAEFQRSHSAGNAAETKLLQDFLGDDTLKLISDSEGAAFRVWRNKRGDVIREIEHPGKGDQRGVERDTVEVTIKGTKRVLTIDEYKALLEADRAAAAAP